MKELWKPIPGYEDRYEISNYGNVASLRYARGSNRRLLKQSVNTWGYSQVTLSKDKVKTNVTAHRLVAEAFVENPNNLPQINHIDEDKSNNHAEIATLPDGTEEYYDSIKTASEILGVNHSGISRALHKRGRHKRSCGREWRFAE